MAKFIMIEKGYHAKEHECFVVARALRKYKYRLESTLQTNNKALTWL